MDPLQFFSNIGRTFGGLTATRKTSLVVVTLLVLAGIWGMVTVSNRTEYRVLFANLSAEDAGSIVDKLKEKKVPFEISKVGDTVSVPMTRLPNSGWRWQRQAFPGRRCGV